MRRFLAHTADLRAELTAPDLASLYDEGLALVREILTGASAVAPRESRQVALAEEEGEGERFFRFLRELVYLADAEAFLPATVRLEDQSAVVKGERFDPQRHVSERSVKAVTRHHFRFERDAAGYRCEVVFDL